MTANEFYRKLASLESPAYMPAPQVPLKLGEQDIMAAKLLLWLQEQLPDNATLGDLEDVLDAAKFWSVFFGAAFTAKEETDQ